jgi:hypothetical protein
MSARTSAANPSLSTTRRKRPSRRLPRRSERAWRPWTLAWFGACGLAITNGIARQAIYEGHVGDLQAHQVSTATLLAVFALYVWMLQRRWPIQTARTALAIGAAWAVLTLTFEFGFGHYVVGQSWAELLEAYNLANGRLWVLVPLWTLVAPAVMRTIKQPRSR